MSHYQFSMEKILDWRLDQEDAAKRKLVAVQQKLQQQQKILDELIQENILIKNASLKISQIEILKNQSLYKEMVNEKILRQKNLLTQIESEVQQAQEALMEAHKDKKAMEKLKEKEYIFTIEKEKKEEQKQLDEIATLSYGRTMY